MDCREVRCMGARQRHAYARLKDSISADDAAQLRVVLRPVQGMGDCANQHLRGVTGKHGVGIERDHEFHVAEMCRIPGYGREGVFRLSPKKAVELSELAALSLPAHPHALLFVP